MKSKLLTIAKLLNICLVAALTLVYSSCSETELVDSTGFALQYYGVTDIGPSMTYTLEAPTYKGSTPYDFTITSVTLNEEVFENADYFVIDAETGAITIQNTESIPTGLYNISVGCYSNGKFYNFKDAVQINMLLAVPDGVTVEPAEVLVNQDEKDWAEASAQVTTEQDKHVSITGYSIVQDESKPYLAYFNIDGKGKITINSETKDKLVAGESYALSLKLTTGAGEHMYADAVTFKVVSKPRTLIYKKKQDIYEKERAGKSGVPTYEGGKDGLVFTIKSVTPETTAFSIDAATGEISLPEGHTLEPSTTPYIFTITASNIYGSTDFEEAYAVTISEYVTPIEGSSFHYAPITQLYQFGGSATQAKDKGFIGDAVVFTFATELNSEEINKAIDDNIISLSTDGKGTVSIANSHTLTIGEHKIYIRATNMKNEETGGVTTDLSVNVVKNPNDFTFISWGTNVETAIKNGYTKGYTIKNDFKITEVSNFQYNNIFRYLNRGSVPADVKNMTLIASDLPNNSQVTYSIVKESFPGEKKFPTSSIDNSGKITLTTKESDFHKEIWGNDYYGGVLPISVTVSGNNDAPQITKTVPIFFTTPKAIATKYTTKKKKEILIFDNSVIRVNPRKGGKFPFTIHLIEYSSGTINEIYNIENLILDYRGTNFSYLNLSSNVTHGSGKITDGGFLSQLWAAYGYSSANTAPISYINTSISKEDKILYINPDVRSYDPTTQTLTGEIIINPDKWKGKDGKYANGVFSGEIRYQINGDKDKIDDTTETTGEAGSSYPLFIWFDENFE